MNDRKLRLRVWENLRSGLATDFSEEYRRLERERSEFLADRVRAIVANVRSNAIDAAIESTETR